MNPSPCIGVPSNVQIVVKVGPFREGGEGVAQGELVKPSCQMERKKLWKSRIRCPLPQLSQSNVVLDITCYFYWGGAEWMIGTF